MKLVALFFILIISLQTSPVLKEFDWSLAKVGLHADDKRANNITIVNTRQIARKRTQYKNDYFVALDFEPSYLVGFLVFLGSFHTKFEISK